MKRLFFPILFLFFSGVCLAQDSVKVSIPALDAEIQQIEQNALTLSKQIDEAQKQLYYLQVAADILKIKRQQWTAKSDSVKATPKKKDKK